jgi:molybdopterin molybdotransferase
LPLVELLGWQGSGDLAALTRANCWAVIPEERDQMHAGEAVRILLR